MKKDVDLVFLTDSITSSINSKRNWGLSKLQIPELWKITKGEGVKIAVLDSGIAYDHPDFKGCIAKMKNFTKSNAGVYDIIGHGTHVAGIISCQNENIGIASKSKLYIGKIIEDNKIGKVSNVIKALKWALKNKVDIINLSFETNDYPKLKKIIKKAFKQNCTVVCSAGKRGPDPNTIRYPAFYSSTIAVGAVNEKFELFSSSSRGDKLDIVAPGYKIYSTSLNKEYTLRDGTSMAAPFVSGIIALMLAKHKKYSSKTQIYNPNDVKEHLTKTAIDRGVMGKDPLYGWGVINPKEFI